MSFFGFVIKSNSSHPEKVPAGCNLVLTQAATDKSASEPTTLYCQTEEIKDKLVICTLTWGRMEQARLDLIFESETDVTFSVSGKGDIHVSGYFVEEELPPDFDSEDEEDEEDEVDEMEESSPILKKKEKSPQGKRPLSNAEQDKSAKKSKVESPKQESPKTSKPETKSEPTKTEKAESPKNESPKTESPKKKKDKKGGDNKNTETKETKSPSQEKKVENGGEKSKKNKKKGKGKK